LARKFTYARAGVDRELRAESKRSLKILEETYNFSRYGEVVQLPYGKIFPFGENCYLDMVIEGVGTKVLIAQLAEKYDTIGIDGVSDPSLVREWMKGIAKGATEAQCIVPSGEIGDVAELIIGLTEGKGFDMVVSAIGEVSKENIISGRNIKAGDVIIGLRSSGIHSNGVSLVRKILFKRWGGKYDAHDVPEGLDREIVYEVLEPTKIYVKPVLRVAREVKVKAAVHITGDGYLKFDRLTQFSKGIGFEFNNFKPQPIFELIQKTVFELGGTITDEEMFKTFNMGWGFAVIVDKADRDKAVDVLEKTGMHAEEIGYVTDTEGIKILYKDKRIVLK